MNAVGIVGLGALGGAITERLLAAGHAPVGFDNDATALARFVAGGGRATDSAEEVFAQSRLVLLALRDEAQIESLVGPGAPCRLALRCDAVVWIMSTVSPDYVARLGREFSSLGGRILDGPVSGGIGRAREGKLTLILAGDDVAVAAAMTLSPILAEHVFRVAAVPGPASMIKAINQLLTACHIALTAETLGLALRAGVDPHVLQEVVSVSAGASRMFADRAPQMLADGAAASAALGIFLKDIEIALGVASGHHASVPVAAAAREVFRHAVAAFGGDCGDTAIFRLYRPPADEL